MNEKNIRVHHGGLVHTVFHVIGVADDQFWPLETWSSTRLGTVMPGRSAGPTMSE